jgi:hypothetical protein
MIEVVVHRDLASRLDREKPQTVLGVTVTVVAMPAEPAHTGPYHIVHLPLVRELVDFLVFAIFPVQNLHVVLP